MRLTALQSTEVRVMYSNGIDDETPELSHWVGLANDLEACEGYHSRE